MLWEIGMRVIANYRILRVKVFINICYALVVFNRCNPNIFPEFAIAANASVKVENFYHKVAAERFALQAAGGVDNARLPIKPKV